MKDLLSGENVEIRIGNTSGYSFVTSNNKYYLTAPNSFNEPTLGVISDARPYIISDINDEQGSYLNIFDNMLHTTHNVKSRIIKLLVHATSMLTPHLLYQYSLASIFENKSYILATIRRTYWLVIGLILMCLIIPIYLAKGAVG